MGVGPHDGFRLRLFGAHVEQGFGHTVPIDFQIQAVTIANDQFEGVRSALIIFDTDLPVVRTTRSDAALNGGER